MRAVPGPRRSRESRAACRSASRPLTADGGVALRGTGAGKAATACRMSSATLSSGSAVESIIRW